MTKRVKLSKWAETAFQNDCELWRTRTNEGMVVLGKLSAGTFTLCLLYTSDAADE